MFKTIQPAFFRLLPACGPLPAQIQEGRGGGAQPLIFVMNDLGIELHRGGIMASGAKLSLFHILTDSIQGQVGNAHARLDTEVAYIHNGLHNPIPLLYHFIELIDILYYYFQLNRTLNRIMAVGGRIFMK